MDCSENANVQKCRNGRPRRPDYDLLSRVCFRIRKDTYGQAQAAAREIGITVSELAELALREWIASPKKVSEKT